MEAIEELAVLWVLRRLGGGKRQAVMGAGVFQPAGH